MRSISYKMKMTLKLLKTNSVLCECFYLQERTGIEKHFKVFFQMHDAYFLFRNVFKECFLNSSLMLAKNSLKTAFHCPAYEKEVRYGPGCALSTQRTSTEWKTRCAETFKPQCEQVHTAHPSLGVFWEGRALPLRLLFLIALSRYRY